MSTELEVAKEHIRNLLESLDAGMGCTDCAKEAVTRCICNPRQQCDIRDAIRYINKEDACPT